MPLPTPNTNEEQREFITRCMTDKVMTTEFLNQDQRLAICAIQWKKK